MDGHWWRAAWVLWLLAFSGYFSGAFIAVGLLLLTSFSVSLVNLMSSLVFVAVTPFIAITQSLLYFDLTTASDEAADAG